MKDRQREREREREERHREHEVTDRGHFGMWHRLAYVLLTAIFHFCGLFIYVLDFHEICL